jgi:hypothetical protein
MIVQVCASGGFKRESIRSARFETCACVYRKLKPERSGDEVRPKGRTLFDEVGMSQMCRFCCKSLFGVSNENS